MDYPDECNVIKESLPEGGRGGCVCVCVKERERLI